MNQGNHRVFEERLRRIQKTHAKARQTTGEYGQVVRRPRKGLRLGIKLILAAVFGVVAVKAGLMAALGPAAYASHREILEQGSGVERFGAVVMTPSPITNLVARLTHGTDAVPTAVSDQAQAPATPIVGIATKPRTPAPKHFTLAPATGQTGPTAGAGHFVGAPAKPKP